MIRRLLFWLLLALISAAVLGTAVWLSSDSLPPLEVTVNGTVRAIPLTSLFLALLVLLGLTAALAIGLFLLGSLPARVERWLARRRREQGMDTLARGMLAVAAGDASQALTLSRKADSLLSSDPQPLTLLLAAQARQLNGDEAAAGEYFKQMTQTPSTAFLGYRGQIVQALNAGDETAARRLAQKARSLQPQAPWVLDLLYHLEARAGQLDSAKTLTQEALRHQLLPRAETTLRLATLNTLAARDALASGRTEAALGLSGEAIKQAPRFLPAALIRAQSLIASDMQTRAWRFIRAFWAVTPHPDFIPLAQQARNASTPEQQRKAVSLLAQSNPDHGLSLRSQAEAALVAGDYKQAHDLSKRALAETEAASQDVKPAARTLAVHALAARAASATAAYQKAIEAYSEAQAAAAEPSSPQEKPEAPDFAEAIAQTLALPQDEAWICASCTAEQPRWEAQCPNCRTVGSIDWRAPLRPSVQSLVELSGNRARITHNP